jgi:hypothetical protein
VLSLLIFNHFKNEKFSDSKKNIENNNQGGDWSMQIIFPDFSMTFP